VDEIRNAIRPIPDFPKPGILFRDITPLLGSHDLFRQAIQHLVAPFRDAGIDRVVGIESRGFILGAPAALELGVGFVPVRKPGKLPAETRRVSYALEYGTDSLEIHVDAILPGQKVLVVDDLLATGGTAAATVELVRALGGEVAGIAFLVELCGLEGRKRLATVPVHAVLQYE
jgi:adenine phosphoribosyltransferase